MVDITFLEIHVEDSPFVAGESVDEEDDDIAFEAAEEATAPSGGGGSKAAVLAALVGMVFLAVVAYVAKTWVLDDDGDDEGFEYDSYD
jgi:hypothetical protein